MKGTGRDMREAQGWKSRDNCRAGVRERSAELGAYWLFAVYKVVSAVESSPSFKNGLNFICLLQIIPLRPLFLLTSPQQMDLGFSGFCVRGLLTCLRPLDLIYPKET